MVINKTSKLVSMLGAGALALGLGGKADATPTINLLSNNNSPAVSTEEAIKKLDSNLHSYILFGIGLYGLYQLTLNFGSYKKN